MCLFQYDDDLEPEEPDPAGSPCQEGVKRAAPGAKNAAGSAEATPGRGHPERT